MSGFIYDTASVSSMHASPPPAKASELRIREEGMSGRTDLPLLRVYTSEQAHSSIDKGMHHAGPGPAVGPQDSRRHRVSHGHRKHFAARSMKTSEKDFCRSAVVATVGTTSTSSIDPFRQSSDICEKHAMWLHVDAAYAGSAAIVPEMRHILDGCRARRFVRAESAQMVIHAFRSLGPVLPSHGFAAPRVFAGARGTCALLKQAKHRHESSEYGIQLGRRFRALKLWMIIRYFGHEGLAARIREHCRLAKLFASWVEESPDWELMAPHAFALVCFRANPLAADQSEARQTTGYPE